MTLGRRLADLYGVGSSISTIAKLSLNNQYNQINKWIKIKGLNETLKFDKTFNNQIYQQRGEVNDEQKEFEIFNKETKLNILKKNNLNQLENDIIDLNQKEFGDSKQIVNKNSIKDSFKENSRIEKNSTLINEETVKDNLLENQNINLNDQREASSEIKEIKKEYKEASVPTTKIGRLFQYGGLAASMGAGMVSEAFKRTVGLSNAEFGESALWSEANVKRLVTRLSRMRGAAQKLGQMLAIQDANVLPPQIEKILFEIQHSGTYMPKHQLYKVLNEELGQDWETKLLNFDSTPFAAASIGQVHWAEILDESNNLVPVAVKIQYPGVAESIDSDLDSLKLMLMASKLLPRGLYLDKTIQVTRRELKWETDYKREAHFATKFLNVLQSSKMFKVPKIYSELSTKMVLTMERIPGVPLNQILDLDQSTRNWIASHIMELCLRELFEFKFMQTDPNWTNFLYDLETNTIGILDFGATREFDDEFLMDYIQVLKAAVENNQEKCIEYSRKLGYLTGDEHSTMVQAHVDSILTLAEPFRASDQPYDFADQTITARVRDLIPVMLQMRLTPPPEPTYSLHRKLSGAFLLCSRLKAKVDCQTIFYNVINNFNSESNSK